MVEKYNHWDNFQNQLHRQEGQVRSELSRRSFLKRLGLTAGGTLAASALGEELFLPRTARAITNDSFYSDGYQRMCYHENPIGPCAPALEAVREVISETGSINRYPDFSYEDLKNKILKYNRAGSGLGPDHVNVGCGSWESLNQLCDTFLAPGSAFLTEWPTYHVIIDRARVVGAQIIKVPHTETPHQPDLPAMKQALADNPNIRLIHFNTINNPIGSFLTRSEFDDFARHVFANYPQAVIVADDSDPEFMDKEERGSYPRFLDYVEQGQNLVQVSTFSHAFALTGLRVGYSIAPLALAQKISPRAIFAGLSQAGLAAAQASLEDAKTQTKRSYENNRDGREYLYGEFDRLGLAYHRSQGSYVIFDVGRDGVTFFTQLLTKKVVLRPGEEWEMTNWIRICPGLPGENEHFIKVLEELLGAPAASSENYLNTVEGKKAAEVALSFGINPYPRRFFRPEKSNKNNW
ncbi:MAG: aminotransferase class I/II-fold pyridoxal phosphate-dependent enzyme [Proteobacteria bacterium]|nr:aminotransferase class I/II-fold pyridoxal phosphate-dependent enzyme [Pseudomonadota bacterium]